VFMGCSCTEFGRYDRFLQDIIESHYPKGMFTCLNLGVAGWTSFQGLQQLKRDVVPMKPRVITIYYGWNDHWCTFGLEDKQIRDFNVKHPLVLTELSRRLRTVQLFNKTVFSRSFPGKTASQRVSIEDFRANLTDCVRVAREHSIIPVLLTAPSSHRRGEEPAYLAVDWLTDLSSLVPLHESYVAAVRDVAHDNEVHLLDLHRLFRDLPEEELRESFYEDGIHLTEKGARRVARYLHEFFVETELIEAIVTCANP
jgi:lysophospholipase L1-like esterase